MKEFKLWLKRQKYSSPTFYYGAEKAWRAALEWALDQCVDSLIHKSTIKEELENK